MYTFERNWYIRYLCVSEYITTRLQTSSISFRFSKNETELSLSDRFSISHARYRRAGTLYIEMHIEKCNKCAPHKCVCVCVASVSFHTALGFPSALRIHLQDRPQQSPGTHKMPKSFSQYGNPFKRITLRFACVCV